jgi:membrane protein
MKWADVTNMVKRTFQRFFAKDTFEMGAALAYYTIFSLAPLVLIAISIAGLVFGQEAASGRISEQISDAVGPTVGDAIQKTLENTRNSGGSTASTIIGVVVLLIGASGVFVQLQNSLNKIWEVPAKETGGVWGFIRTRLLSFAMVLGVGFLLLVSLIISTVLSALSNYLAPGQTALYQIVNQVVSFLVITALLAAIFKYLPDTHVSWRHVWIGAAVTAVLFIVGKYLIGLYLAKGSVASAYGAAGSLVIILVWVCYASQILLFGAQFTQVHATLDRDAEPKAADGRAAPERASADASARREADRTPSTNP